MTIILHQAINNDLEVEDSGECAAEDVTLVQVKVQM